MNSAWKNISFGYDIEKKGATPSLFKQVHGGEIVTVGNKSPSAISEADGGVAFHCPSEVYVFTADCLPVLLFSENPEEPITALHAGWRSSSLQIVKKALKFYRNPELLHAVLGPCIKPCCFEVKNDLIETFRNQGNEPAPFILERNSKLYFDLPSFILNSQLANIPQDHLFLDWNLCTYCSSKGFPSYRRNGSTETRIRSWIRKS